MTIRTRKEIGADLLRRVAGDTMALTLGAPNVAEIRPSLERAGFVSRRPEASTPAVDPNGDPLELLSKEERELLERRPYLKKLLLEDIGAAEAGVTAEREKQRLAEERERAHAENDQAHEIAARIIKQRAEARGGSRCPLE
ncbi:MAG TPA: hypothetical protein VFV10_02215 [Gammaproteobacteria bacterium]|nr:hypothetical protein [Gammaproteobacteria bacterium]